MTYWCSDSIKPDWLDSLGWQWTQDGELAEFFGALFDLHLEMCDVDAFLFQKVRKKLIYWSSRFLFLSARAIIANMILLSMLWYFIFLWLVSKQVIRKIQVDIKNYLWTGSFNSSRARVNWRDC